MVARIYKPSRNAMQSGMARTKEWVLELEPEVRREVEPLMGWTSSADTRQQVRLSFDTREQAEAYAQKNGIAYELVPEAPARTQKKSYSDNFRWGRPENWTH
jgi:hypothetical protein